MGERDRRFDWLEALDALGITKNDTFAGSVLFVSFCVIGILYLGAQTLEPKECVCSWSFLNSFMVVLGKKLGILGTSSLIATLILVSAWRIYKNLREAIRIMWSDQFKSKLLAEGEARGEARGKARMIEDLLNNRALNLPRSERRRLERELENLMATSSR